MALFKTTEVNGVPVIAIEGRFTMEDDMQLDKRVRELTAEGKPRIVLDVSGTEFVDTCGLGEIVRCYTLASRAGGRLVLAGLPDEPAKSQPRDLLALTKLISVFEVFPTPGEAAASLAA